MLKDLIKSQEKKGYVIPLLEESALLNGKMDSYKRRRDCFHPSEISGDFCPRAWILGQRDKTLYYEDQVGPQTQWRFDVGTEVHELVQRRLGSTGKLFGLWECRRWCLEDRCVHYGFKPEKKCPLNTDHKVKWEYKEVPVIDEELEIYGETDGIVVLKEGKYIFEFKTSNSRTFSTLAEPLDTHKEQAEWYMDVLSRNSHKMEAILEDMQRQGIDVEEVLRVQRQPFRGTVIVYMNKDTQAFKEFVVNKTGPIVMPDKIKIRGLDFDEDGGIIEEKKKVLRQTLQWRDEGYLPERLDVCISKSCTRARGCFARNACFNKEDK